MQTTHAILAPFLAAVLLPGALRGLDTVMETRSWANNDKAFAQLDQRIGRMRGRNLLARKDVKIVDKGQLSYGQLAMLTDGSAGVRLGEGRVGSKGQPAVLTYYLGGPKVITRVGVYTFNSDARANQDFEVRFANHAENPGVKPVFSDEPHLTTGPTILGKNTGGFNTVFFAEDRGELVPGKADWVQFRIWRTYNQKAGSPAKEKNKANGWTALIELEVLGDDTDVIEFPEDDVARQQREMARILRNTYVKKDTWQDTMLAAREAFAAATEAENGKVGRGAAVRSPLMRGGNAPARVRISVTGWKRLWLEADVGGDTYDSDQAVWGEPTLIAADGTKTALSSLRPVISEVGWGELVTDKDHRGKPLDVAGTVFKAGLWAHAPSRLCYELDGKYAWFEARVGIAATAGSKGSSRFRAGELPSVDADFARLWAWIGRDFRDPGSQREIAWEKEDRIWEESWPSADRKTLALRYANACHRCAPLAGQAAALAEKAGDDETLRQVRELYHGSRRAAEALAAAEAFPWKALRLAAEDLVGTFGAEYAPGERSLEEISAQETRMNACVKQVEKGSPQATARLEELLEEAARLQRETLLANPLLDFERLLLIRRKTNNLGLPANWQSNSSLAKTGYDNELAVLSLRGDERPLSTLYRPDGGKFVGDVDLHFDAGRMLFSSIGTDDRWHLFEIEADGAGLRQVTPADQPDVDYYDACYLPDEDIMFCSTANFVGVPCVYGSSHVAMLYRMHPDGTGIRQLAFEQDHDWCPTVLSNGRVLYSRWEYPDTPHSNTRLLFHMNPDGTGQAAYYGSNSYWPNAIFYARPMPGHSSKVVGIVSGHHGDRRMGELVIFDPALGRREADGVVQRIPGYGKKVEPIIKDQLTVGVWPKFLHPYPLSEKYILVSCQPKRGANWGIYLVDTFDNMVLLKEEPGYALFEPIPFRPTPRPPVLRDRVARDRTDAVIHLADVYAGPGLAGVPRGTVKRLRLFTYHFAYQGMGGLLGVVGLDGPWDIKRVLGTVPVEEDGSALFRVPANTPISVQPLDEEGKALQLMRSWMTAMPGEVLSCVGCHESRNSAPPARKTLAANKEPVNIEPWYGPTRGFSYPREVQPVIDKYCVGCHDGGDTAMDLRGSQRVTNYRMVCPGNGGNRGGKFSAGYANLHRFVRRPGIESDYHLLTPLEFHADTTELVQMLQSGHHGVNLNAQAWDRLITWIDLNAPYHGTWGENIRDPGNQRQRRRELRKLYAFIDEDPEADADLPPADLGDPVKPAPERKGGTEIPSPKGWPFRAEEAGRRQKREAGEEPPVRKIDLGEGVELTLSFVPGGTFVMGDGDRQPSRVASVTKGFWMGSCEVSNEQYARFDPRHDSRVESKNAYQFGIHGYPVNRPKQPVVRLSWERATAFCDWLSERTGREFRLPTEEQWEYACRAGTDSAFSFGKAEADFSAFANLADAKLKEFASDPYTVSKPLKNASPFDDYIPKQIAFNDGGLVSMPIGSYKPNAWGLHDMHGNVWEWTRTERNGERVVRGGSWRDRPQRCQSGSSLSYPPYQRVFNVGFRVICDDLPGGGKLTRAN